MKTEKPRYRILWWSGRPFLMYAPMIGPDTSMTFMDAYGQNSHVVFRVS